MRKDRGFDGRPRARLLRSPRRHHHSGLDLPRSGGTRAVHVLSRRAHRPFVAINCAALGEALLESELFGHERCAFTCAVAQKKGKLEMAEGGTHTISLDIRLIAATYGDLAAEAKRPCNREDFDQIIHGLGMLLMRLTPK